MSGVSDGLSALQGDPVAAPCLGSVMDYLPYKVTQWPLHVCLSVVARDIVYNFYIRAAARDTVNNIYLSVVALKTVFADPSVV